MSGGPKVGVLQDEVTTGSSKGGNTYDDRALIVPVNDLGNSK